MQTDIIRSSGEVIDVAHKILKEKGFYERYWKQREEWDRLADLESDPKKAFNIRYGIGSWKN